MAAWSGPATLGAGHLCSTEPKTARSDRPLLELSPAQGRLGRKLSVVRAAGRWLLFARSNGFPAVRGATCAGHEPRRRHVARFRLLGCLALERRPRRTSTFSRAASCASPTARYLWLLGTTGAYTGDACAAVRDASTCSPGIHCPQPAERRGAVGRAKAAVAPRLRHSFRVTDHPLDDGNIATPVRGFSCSRFCTPCRCLRSTPDGDAGAAASTLRAVPPRGVPLAGAAEQCDRPGVRTPSSTATASARRGDWARSRCTSISRQQQQWDLMRGIPKTPRSSRPVPESGL